MASISSPGIGSGLDINGIVNKLMQVEAQPLNKINQQEASFQARISALGALQSAVSTLNNSFNSLSLANGQSALEKFTSYKASIADSAVANANATSTSVAGSYSLEVIQLAKAHRITTTAGFANADAAITQGTLSVQIGSGTAKPLVIDAGNDTLGELRDAINAAGYGVTAALTEVTPGDVRLSLTSTAIGTGGEIKLSGLPGFNFDVNAVGNDFSQAAVDGGQPAQGAIAKINGLTINSASNTLGGAIQGVTLTLLKETTAATNITVSHDSNTAVRAALEGVVKAYNELNKTIKDLGSYDSESKQASVLLGDATLRTIASSLRNVFQNSFGATGNIRRLSDLGVSFQRDGSITFDSSKLTAASAADVRATVGVATAFAKAAKTLTAGTLGSNGTLAAATNGAQASVKALTAQRERLADRLTQVEARYKKQFSALDSLVASMNQTSSYLQRQLASLPGGSSSQ